MPQSHTMNPYKTIKNKLPPTRNQLKQTNKHLTTIIKNQQQTLTQLANENHQLTKQLHKKNTT